MATKKKVTKTTRAKPADAVDVGLLEDTFAALAPQGPALVQRFYEELFRRYPDIKPLFAGVSLKHQQKKLLAALVQVVNRLRQPEALDQVLTDLGARHQHYGVKPEHYEAVASTLLDVMREFAGELWTEAVHAAWSRALNRVATTMIQAYQPTEAKRITSQVTK